MLGLGLVVGVASVLEVKRVYEGRLLGIQGVAGVVADVGRNVLVVLVEDRRACSSIPRVIDSVRVECRVIGRVKRFSEPEARDLEDKLTRGIIDLPGIVGLSVRDPPGVREIVLFVEDPSLVDAMPSTIYDTRVRVVVTGRITALSLLGQYDLYRSRHRPIVGGISVGVLGVPSTGTLTLCLEDGLCLSNAHVIAMDIDSSFLQPGISIIQPGTIDGGTDDDVVGVLSGYKTIEFNNPDARNKADIAWFTPVESYSPLDIAGEYTVTIPDMVDIKQGQQVRKTGRTTGMTISTIEYESATIRVWYTEDKYAVFTDTIITGKMAEPGDSGSPVDSNGELIGVLFAGSESISAINRIDNVLSSIAGPSITNVVNVNRVRVYMTYILTLMSLAFRSRR